LLYHSYLHYLYLPLVGLALALAGAWEWAAGAPAARGGRAGLRRAAACAAALVVVLGWTAASRGLVRERLAARTPGLDVPLDPFLRKAEYARRTAAGIHDAVREGRRRIAFLVPAGPSRIYAELIRSTLDDGRALRMIEY